LWFQSVPTYAQSQYQFTATFDTHEKLPGEVERLQRLAAQQAWEPWVTAYQALIDEHPDAVLAHGEERLVGLRATLHAQLAALPAAAREIYRRKFDAAARPLWEKAKAAEDPEAMTRLHLRYRHTRFGPRSLRWLADRALDTGEYELARLAYARLATEDASLQPGWASEADDAWMRLRWGMAATLAGRPAEAREAWDSLTRRHGNLDLTVAGTPRRVAQIVADERGRLRPPPLPVGWPHFAGSPAGGRRMTDTLAALFTAPGEPEREGAGDVDRSTPGSPPAPAPLPAENRVLGLSWTAATAPANRDRNAFRVETTPWGGVTLRSSNTSLFNALTYPVTDESHVYLQTPSGARAVNLADGAVLWNNSELGNTRGARNVQRRYYGYNRSLRNLQLAPTMAGPHLVVRAPVGQGEGWNDGRWPSEFALAALDRRTGRAVWTRLAGGNPAGSFFNLPTARAQTLFTGIATAVAGLTEYRACAVDAGTGARRWTAYLGTGSDPMSSIDGSPAAVADGIVWTESSLHTLNALDSVTGEILWIYRYQPRPIPYYRSGWQDRMTLPNEPISLIAPAGERLLFAPRWGDQCVALDGRTGKVLWSAPRGDARSLFAVDEARAYLCGNEVHALDLATGARRWSWTAPDARAGYAALAGDRVYVPVGPTVYVLDRATGRQVAQLDLGSHQVEAEFGAALLAGSRFLLSQPERLFALEAPMRQTLLSRQPSVIGRERED
jgi:outer membrane protein assembly factor BamB